MIAHLVRGLVLVVGLTAAGLAMLDRFDPPRPAILNDCAR